MESRIHVPILLMVFNRPDKTQRVFNVIKDVKPSKLYIAADAPRAGNLNDAENCKKVRDIVEAVDWDCEVKYLYHESNLGCSLAGKTAWDWIFEFEEEMIFIEDDGLLSPSFFSYAQILLEKYRDNPKIAYISSENFGIVHNEKNSYFFSRFGGGTYGMATWKRVYELYEFDLKSYNDAKDFKKYRHTFINKFHFDFVVRKFDHYLKYGGNTYDLQIVYLLHKFDMYNIIPNVNMCANIGFDFDGTNTNIDPESEFALKYGNREISHIKKVIHPMSFEINSKVELRNLKERLLYGKSYPKFVLHFYLQPYFSPIYQSLKRIFKIR